MSKLVFISYTSANRPTALGIVDYLEKNGISCFIAPRDIDGGANYASTLVKAISDCELALLVCSAAINGREHVLNEVDIIIEKQKPILPVFIEDFILDPDYRYYLGRKQWVVAYPDETSTYYGKILNSVEEKLPAEVLQQLRKTAPAGTQEEEEDEYLQGSKTVFEYDQNRGIMINPEDHTRNISFRQDTFLSLMAGLYDSLATASGEDVAEKAFFDCGFRSGSGFAKRIGANWHNGYSLESVRQMLKKWCQFDSAVGWGRFDMNIDYDDVANELIGQLSISEAFVVDDVTHRKTCNFIKGYCTGVLSTLLEIPDLQLTCKECPMGNRFKCKCVFEMKAVM